MDVAAVASAVGVLAAGGAAPAQALRVAWEAAAVLFAAPRCPATRSGDQPRLLAPLGDLLHLGAAAVWLGGARLAPVRVPGERGACAHDRRAPLLELRDPDGARARRGRRFARADAARLAEPAVGDELRAHAARESGLLLVLIALGRMTRGRLAAGSRACGPWWIAELARCSWSSARSGC